MIEFKTESEYRIFIPQHLTESLIKADVVGLFFLVLVKRYLTKSLKGETKDIKFLPKLVFHLHLFFLILMM